MRSGAIGTAKSVCRLVRNDFSLKIRQHCRVITAVKFQNNLLIRIIKTEIHCPVRKRFSEQYGYRQ